MTIARGHLELLRWEHPASPELAVALDELARIERIIARLLLLAKAERPDFLAPREIDVETFVEDVFVRWSDVAPRVWRLGPVAAGTLCADEEALRTALDALLENAVKHTEPHEAIELRARAVGRRARARGGRRGPRHPAGGARADLRPLRPRRRRAQPRPSAASGSASRSSPQSRARTAARCGRPARSRRDLRAAPAGFTAVVAAVPAAAIGSGLLASRRPKAALVHVTRAQYASSDPGLSPYAQSSSRCGVDDASRYEPDLPAAVEARPPCARALDASLASLGRLVPGRRDRWRRPRPSLEQKRVQLCRHRVERRAERRDVLAQRVGPVLGDLRRAREPTTTPSASSAAARACSGVEMPKPA